MGVFIFLGIMGSLLVGTLLTSMIADLTWWMIVALLAVVLLIGGYFVIDNSDSFQTVYWRWRLPAFPPDETAFIAVAGELRALRVELATGADRDVALRETEARLCALPVVASNWIGRVEQRYSVNSGEGASLTIGISPHVVVRTAFFPDNTGTLIRIGSPLFAPVNGLEQGDVVRFSGTIVGHAGACPNDPPIDANEKLRDPEFLLRFAQVAKDAAH